MLITSTVSFPTTFSKAFTLYQRTQLALNLGKRAFKKTVGKGENVSNQNFLFFRQCFLLFLKRNLSFLFTSTFRWSISNAFNFDNSKIILFNNRIILEIISRADSVVRGKVPNKSYKTILPCKHPQIIHILCCRHICNTLPFLRCEVGKN